MAAPMVCPVGRFLRSAVISRSLIRTFFATNSTSTSSILCWNCAKSQFQSTKPKLVLKSAVHRENFNSFSVAQRNMSGIAGKDKDYIFRQLLDYKSFTYTYLLADGESKEAVLVDPVYELVDRDVKLVRDLGLDLKFAVNTHVHADHITGTGEIKKRIPSCKSVITEASGAEADIKTKHGSTVEFGKFALEVRSTPGHTDGCCTYVWHEKGMAFTGDALLIRGCGRTDFQQGNASTLYNSVHTQIFSLPLEFQLFPAHDYTGQTSTTVAEERNHNPRLTKSQQEFVDIMAKLNLPYPKQIDRAVPANLLCGVFDVPPK